MRDLTRDKGEQTRLGMLLLAGGSAGAVARTVTAPLDRVKILFQVQHVSHARVHALPYSGVGQALVKIWHEEGVRAYWKGNAANVIRIFPYSATQFVSHDMCKELLAGPDGKLTVAQRLLAGALAGISATSLTHPLDTLRLRLALPNAEYSGILLAVRNIIAKEGASALYKGIVPSILAIAPYAAVNFASYDMLKNLVHNAGQVQGVPTALLLGSAAGLVATTTCYPLDTVRRRMQMRGTSYSGTLHALSTIYRREGIRGYYRGLWANCLKTVPQNGIRFVAFDIFKSFLSGPRAAPKEQ